MSNVEVLANLNGFSFDSLKHPSQRLLLSFQEGMLVVYLMI